MKKFKHYMMKRNESIYVNDQHTDVQNQMQQGQPQGQQQQAPVHLGHSGLNAEQSQVVTAAFAYVEQHSATDPHAKDLMQRISQIFQAGGKSGKSLEYGIPTQHQYQQGPNQQMGKAHPSGDRESGIEAA